MLAIRSGSQVVQFIPKVMGEVELLELLCDKQERDKEKLKFIGALKGLLT